MPLTSYIYVSLHYYCGLHMDITLLHMQVQKEQSATATPYIIAKYVPGWITPLKCHMFKLVHVQIWDNYVSIYTSYEHTAINSVSMSTTIKIPFTLLAYAHEHICLQHLTCMCYCTNATVYMWTSHYCTYKSKTTINCSFYLSCYNQICAKNKYAPQISDICHMSIA